MTDRKPCKGKTKAGWSCTHWARPGSDYCRLHGAQAGPPKAPRKVRFMSDYKGEWEVVELDGERFCAGHDFPRHEMVRLLRKLGVEVEDLEVTFGDDGDDTTYTVLATEEEEDA